MSILHKDEYVDDDIGVFHAHGEMLFILIPMGDMDVNPANAIVVWMARIFGLFITPEGSTGAISVQIAPTGLPDVFHPDSTEFHWDPALFVHFFIQKNTQKMFSPK